MKNKFFNFNLVTWILRVIILLFLFAPIYAMIIVAFTPFGQLMKPQLFPQYFEFRNFLVVWGGGYKIGIKLINSFIYSFGTVVATLLISVPSSYVIARYRFIGRQPVLFILLLTQMITGIVILPTLYLIYLRLNLIDTQIGVILALTGFNIALSVWLLVGFFASLPREVEEAALIDGASTLYMLLKIIVPISAPGIAVSSIFAFLNSYNEFVIPMFLIQTPEKQAVTVGIADVTREIAQPQWNLAASSAIIGIIPPIIIFFIFERLIIKGLVKGAVKM